MLETILFYGFSVLTIGGAILTITRPNVVMSAVCLITSLLGVAGLFLLQGAEFVFVAQLILYIGGVVLLILIALMLVSPQQPIEAKRFRKAWPLVLALGLLFGGELISVFARASFPVVEGARKQAANTEAVADTLFTHYLAAFEVASVILLVAIIGAVVMGQRREEQKIS
jgi:NADH-quinone oxidoreductase subunit J